MNYKVLYRKYRPDKFTNLIGQENTVRILKNSIILNKISHAYIFSGPRGTGKTSSAKIFAKNINCLNPVDGEACGECLNCINSSTSNDIIEIDAASNNGINEIREITNNIKMAPNMMKYKVYIIDEVHMLSTQAFNALLLTLEEPPSHVVFILATTNIESVPITILSRTQRFDFRKITNEDITKTLKGICEKESIIIDDDAIEEISRLSDGGLRDSLSLLDQVSKESDKIDLELVTKFSGNVSKLIIDEMFKAIEDSDIVNIDRILCDLASKNVDYKLFIKSLVTRISIIVKNIVTTGRIKRLSIDDYKKMLLDLTDCQNKINVNVDVYSMLLVVIVSYIDVNNIVPVKVDENNTETDKKEVTNIQMLEKPVENVIKEIVSEKKEEEIEKSVKVENVIKEDNSLIVEKYSKLKDIRVNNCFVNANKTLKGEAISIWNEFVLDSDMSVRGLIMDSEVVMASNDVYTISFERENDLLEVINIANDVEEIFCSTSNKNIKLIFISKNDWNNYVEKYKNDKINGIMYTVMDENILASTGAMLVSDIFDSSKIEEG